VTVAQPLELLAMHARGHQDIAFAVAANTAAAALFEELLELAWRPHPTKSSIPEKQNSSVSISADCGIVRYWQSRLQPSVQTADHVDDVVVTRPL
jgi:hypothetical protein